MLVGLEEAEQADAEQRVWDRAGRQWEVLADLSSYLQTPTLPL